MRIYEEKKSKKIAAALLYSTRYIYAFGRLHRLAALLKCMIELININFSRTIRWMQTESFDGTAILDDLKL